MQEGFDSFVSVVAHVGHSMTYKILIDDTHKVIDCSYICTDGDPFAMNLKTDSLDGDIDKGMPSKFVISLADDLCNLKGN